MGNEFTNSYDTNNITIYNNYLFPLSYNQNINSNGNIN